MCGRFALHTPIDELVERFSLPGLDFDYSPSYNTAPTQQVLTVLSVEETRSVAHMRWGLVPPWQKEAQNKPPIINARLETLAEKPTFRRLVNARRCLILADGFFEWRREDSTKYPVYITLDPGQPFAFAGLWQNGTTPSCTIVTQEASSLIKPIHHRMPLILTPETERVWLSPMPFAQLQALLPDQEARAFSIHRVSTLVNSPKNNEAACIVPIA
ncbi:MAG TPA: hypothetical protein DDW87_10670 [Firmicutes bacterium]|nr:hypothetical protein [Bacillota bacterium]